MTPALVSHHLYRPPFLRHRHKIHPHSETGGSLTEEAAAQIVEYAKLGMPWNEEELSLLKLS
ncbi:hypothetical protein BC936DRAFT_149811 [Jimgerdemannia flammicorona]|uniref:Uncharacterized protein n=1 Tax=Jimgerdemannia flammicorona TaxID=994334 RepID=A0A433D031_9FUNG|nr:hypothetical protein BC936DRAFT_149811 [Jimgerdemannia flammicorona]